MSVARKANWIALLWTSGVSLALLFVPMYETETDVYTIGPAAGPVPPASHGWGTLADENGARVYVLLVIPVLAALAPILVRRRERWRRAASWVAAAVIALLVMLAMTTIGLAYVPALIPLAVAGVLVPEPAEPAAA